MSKGHFRSSCSSSTGSGGSALNLIGMLIRVDFLQRFGQVQVNGIQAHLPLLDPASHLDALFALLPFVRFRLEFLLRRLGDVAGKRPRHLLSLVVFGLRLSNRFGERRYAFVECGDDYVQRLRTLAKFGRQ
jgi:hypothetical protein